MGWPQLVVSAAIWAAMAGRMRAWYSAWAVSRSGPASGSGEVEGGVELAEDVQAVAAQRVLGPAGAEDGEVAVAGPVHALDPVPQPGPGPGRSGGGVVPGRACRVRVSSWAVSVAVSSA